MRERCLLTRIQDLQQLVVRPFDPDQGEEQVRVSHAVPRSSVVQLACRPRQSAARHRVVKGGGMGWGD